MDKKPFHDYSSNIRLDFKVSLFWIKTNTDK